MQALTRLTSGTYWLHNRIASPSHAARCSGVPPCAAAGCAVSARPMTAATAKTDARCRCVAQTPIVYLLLVLRPPVSVRSAPLATVAATMHPGNERKRAQGAKVRARATSGGPAPAQPHSCEPLNIDG